VSRAVLAGDDALAVRAAGRLQEIYGPDRFWIELGWHWLPDDARLLEGLKAVAEAAGARTVATNDVHYATPAGQPLHDVLVATRHNLPLSELGSLRKTNNEYYLKGSEEMARLFAQCPGAVAETSAIAERCKVSLDFSGQRLPAFLPRTEDFPQGIQPGENAFSTLHALCQAGLTAKYRPVTSKAAQQLIHELSVIERAQLCDYFLIVWDIVRFARAAGIRCQGRGSAANSLVAYLLDITPVDPLRFNLLFERFLSDQTDTMPDIDIDFDAERRDEVVEYVYGRYGREHAAMVCNVVTYQARSAVRDVARALGYRPETVDRLSKKLAPDLHGTPDLRYAAQPDGADKGVLAQEPRPEAAEGDLELLVKLARELVDTPRHLSVHVGGVLITAQPLVEVVPVEHATKPGTVVVQWNKDSVEDAGLVKIDLLCLRTLGMVTEAAELMKQAGIAESVDGLSLDDPAVYQLLAQADTIGCFQVESRAQSQMLPRLKPKCFEDIVIQVSIVRPGPIQGGMVHPYLRRRQGLEPVTYLHPALEPALKETLGVIIFQEQVIRVAVALAGFTPGEADRLRRAMSRSRSQEAMAELRERFVAGASRNGIGPEIAEEAFRQLQGFATYGFCKSHAAAFALTAYQTLWMKAHYPVPLYCALLNQQPMGFYSPDVVVNDAKRHGIPILRPDVNLSDDGCTIVDWRNTQPSTDGMALSGAGSIRLGLRYLYSLGEAGRKRLLAARESEPFGDLQNFCRRTRLPRVVIANLIRAGALDSLGADRRGSLWQLGGLHYHEEELVDEPIEETDLPELLEREALAWDYELLGLSPDEHVMHLLRPRLDARGVLRAVDLAGQRAGAIVQVAGRVAIRQRPPTAKGHVFITLEDETGLVNLILRPDLYEAQRTEIREAGALIAKGILQREGVSTSVLVREVQSLVKAVGMG
jgi:error-prone DNA polymerase